MMGFMGSNTTSGTSTSTSAGPTETAHPVLCDLDGVVWLSHHPIPGSVEAIARLRAAGHRVVFVTNNSFATVIEQERALENIGIPARGDVVTSSMAAGTLLAPGQRVLVCGGPGIVEAVRVAGADVVSHAEFDAGNSGSRSSRVDAVIVGFHRDFDYESMRRAARAVRDGARFIGTNEDATYPTSEGEIPGGGSILAAIRTAVGHDPVVAGKPHRTMAACVREMLASSSTDSTAGALDAPATRDPLWNAVMVGDRPATDGRFAREVGCRFALVRSGVSSVDDELAASSRTDAVRVDIEAADLAGVADVILGP